MAGRRLLSVVAAFVLCGVASQGARAQLWPLDLKAPGLTGSDIEIAAQATRRLFEPDGASVGESLIWDNPATGNSGYTTFEKALKFKGLPCRRLRYDIALVKPVRQRSYTVTWCLTPKDGWKMAH